MIEDCLLRAEYTNGMSVPEIARKYRLSQVAIYRYMRKNGISRRNFFETNALRFQNKPLSYSCKYKLSSREQNLKIAGLMLYWAEGYKRNSIMVDLANSDSRMIKMFLKFLRQIYRIDEGRLRVLLYCYSNQSQKELIKYWSHVTLIPSSQFSKPYIRQDFVAEKIDRMPHGLIHVRYSDKRLVAQILTDIEQLTKQLLG